MICYRFSERLKKIDIWKKIAEKYPGIYKIINTEYYEEPVYRDDYIEPYSYRTRKIHILQDINTNEVKKVGDDLLKYNFEKLIERK